MKVLYFLYALFYAYLIHLGFYYLEVDAALWAEFDRVGWERYEGLALDYPENTYYLIWIIASIFTAFIAWGGTLTEEDSAIAPIVLLVAVVSVIGYGLLYIADGRFSIKESQVGWIFTGGFQILIGVGGIFGSFVSRFVDFGLKQLFFVNGLVYVFLFLLGRYFLDLDNNILAEMARLGDAYEGLHYDYPENTYHLILTVAPIISLFLGTMEKDSFFYPMYTWTLIIFFLYGIFVFINDGNPDMRETQYWWMSLTILTSLLSFLISRGIENKLPKREEEEPFYDDIILDDLSSLE